MPTESDSPAPLAVYEEVLFQLSYRRFELYSDHVSIRGTVRSMRIEGSVKLGAITLPPDRTWRHTKHANWSAATMAILSVFVIAPFLVWPPMFTILIPGTIVFLPSVAYYIYGRRHIPFLHYKNDNGIVILELAQAGRSAREFPQFVDQLETAITAAQSVAEPPVSPD